MSFKPILLASLLLAPIGAVAQTNCASPNYASGLFRPGCLSWQDLNNSWASPPVLGSAQPNNAIVNNLTILGSITGGSFSAPFAAPPPIGNVTPSTGAFTVLSSTGNLTIGGKSLFGTGTLGNTGNYGFQTAFNADPSALSGDARQNFFNTTLSYAHTTANIWENLNSFVAVNGPAAANAEINLAHTYLEVEVGADAAVAENYEASAENLGIVGSYSGYLAIFHNTSAATVNAINGLSTYLTNDNTTAGAIVQWAGMTVTPMVGAGSHPTFYDAIVVKDPLAGIVTLGGINIGSVANATADQLHITGLDNSSGTYPFIFQNTISGTPTNVFYFTDAGLANFAAAGVQIAPGAVNFLVQGADNSSGTFPFVLKNLAGTVLLSVDDAGDIRVGATAGVTCATGLPSSSFASVNGIVTHC
jgi:hypothetical protein